jgi:hypothetical protein
MGVKLLDEAAKRAGGVAELHRALIRAGVDISLSTLVNATSRANKSLKFQHLCAIVDVAFNGDWNEAGKLIEKEFRPRK